MAEVCERENLTQTVDVTRVGKRVNQRYKRVTSSIGLNTFRRVVSSFVCVLSTRTQTITGIEKVFSIVNANLTNGEPLDEISYAEMLERIPSTTGPSCYAVKRTGSSSVTLVFDYAFTAATTLTVEGEEQASTLSGATVPAFSESFHDILIFGAQADELRKKKQIQAARDAELDFERRLGELRLHVAVSAYKDVQQGKQNLPLGSSSPSALYGGSVGGGAALDGAFNLLTVNSLAHFLGNVQIDGAVLGPLSVTGAISATTTITATGNITGLDLFGRSLTLSGVATAGAAGKVFTTAADGFTIQGITGGTYDFSVWTPAGTRVLSLLTGTSNFRFAGSIIERGRTAALGEWIDFTPTKTASAGTWTGGTVFTAHYMLVGKTLFVSVYLTSTTVSNAAVTLNIGIPGGFVAAKREVAVGYANNAGAGGVAAIVSIVPAATVITLYATMTFTTWGIAAGTTETLFQVAFEIQ